MDVVYSPKAISEIQDLPEEVREKVREKIDELKDDPTGHKDSKLIRIAGREVYRLEIRDSRGAKLDHKAVYDYENGKIRIYSVIDRDEGYDSEKLEERL
ncbi:MAG: type II toxin-antitoxin system RelE/ParE family toxin [Candidatus Nanosalina sp.]